jgi:chromosome segregation ATPase
MVTTIDAIKEKLQELDEELDDIENECEAAPKNGHCKDADCFECGEFWQDITDINLEIEDLYKELQQLLGGKIVWTGKKS